MSRRDDELRTAMHLMQGEVESYFATIGDLGKNICATDSVGKVLALAEAVAWSLLEVERIKRDRQRVFFIGNGGSAGVASHMATDWLKNGGFSAMAFNDAATLTCITNDLGYDSVFALPLSSHAHPGDLLFAISSSGESQNILSAVDAARGRGATVITLSGFSQDNALRRAGDMNFYVPNRLYGFVEIAHLSICHVLLDLAMGWRADGQDPVYANHAGDAGGRKSDGR